MIFSYLDQYIKRISNLIYLNYPCLTLTPTSLPAVFAVTLLSQSSLEDDHVAWVICWSGPSLSKFHTDKYSAAPIGLKIAMNVNINQRHFSHMVKTQRAKRDWTQEQLTRAIGSSQSRIAKLEGGDLGISLDLMIKALLRLWTSKKEMGKLFEGELEAA